MATIDISSDRKFKATEEWMADRYRTLNEWLFNGELGECRFEVTKGGRGSMGRTLGWFSVKANGLGYEKDTKRMFIINSGLSVKVYVKRQTFYSLCNPVIQMNGNYSGTEYSLLSTLLHEMCHYATYMDGIYQSRSHGREFMYWASLVSRRSNGIFSVQGVATAEDMAGYELDQDVADANKRREDSKKSRLTSAFVFRTNGNVELTLTSHQNVLDRLYLRNTDPEMGASRYGTISMIAYSKDPELMDRLFEKGYKSDSRTYNYYNINPVEIFGKQDFIRDYKHSLMFAEDKNSPYGQ